MNMEDFRCKYCNKLFFKGNVRDADIEVKCRNCKNFCLINKRRRQETLLFSDGEGNYKK